MRRAGNAALTVCFLERRRDAQAGSERRRDGDEVTIAPPPSSTAGGWHLPRSLVANHRTRRFACKLSKNSSRRLSRSPALSGAVRSRVDVPAASPRSSAHSPHSSPRRLITRPCPPRVVSLAALARSRTESRSTVSVLSGGVRSRVEPTHPSPTVEPTHPPPTGLIMRPCPSLVPPATLARSKTEYVSRVWVLSRAVRSRVSGESTHLLPTKLITRLCPPRVVPPAALARSKTKSRSTVSVLSGAVRSRVDVPAASPQSSTHAPHSSAQRTPMSERRPPAAAACLDCT